MGMESRYIWMDGKLVEFEKATVHFLNVGLHYGLAVFEGIRCYNTNKGPAVFRLQEHAKRLIDSAHVLGMRDLLWSAEDVAEAIKQTIAANDFGDCYIRPVIWLSEGGWNINVDGAKPHLGIAAWVWGAYLGEAAIEAGIRANISSYTRHHTNTTWTVFPTRFLCRHSHRRRWVHPIERKHSNARTAEGPRQRRGETLIDHATISVRQTNQAPRPIFHRSTFRQQVERLVNQQP